MASALQLNAQATLINGLGLTTNPELLYELGRFQSLAGPAAVRAAWAAASASLGNVELFTELSNLGSGVTQAQWLIDNHPASYLPPACSIPYACYAVDYVTGINIPGSASFSGTVHSQAVAPFQSGMSEFANVFITSYGYANQTFDTTASQHMLNDTTYGKSGVGYKNTTDLATGGLGNSAAILSNTVAHWGTMYDITNIGKLGDPYVFGQNLLNQGLGRFGNWDHQLTSVGLDITNLSQIPSATSINSAQPSQLSTSTPYGSVTMPSTQTKKIVTVVPGRSQDVVLSIYANVTGANLSAIVSGTHFQSNTTLSSLKDYLTLSNVIPSGLAVQLKALGINTFAELAKYLQARVGQGSFTSWADLANILASIQVPSQKYTPPTSNTSPVLSSSTKSTLQNSVGTGTGPLSNHIMKDFLGAVAGTPYIEQFKILTSYYGQLPVSNLESALNTLLAAVQAYSDAVAAEMSGGGGGGGGGGGA